MLFCPQFNKHHRKLLEKLYSPSCELQRKAEEDVNNQQRHKEWLKKSTPYRYEDKKENLDVTDPWYSHIDGDMEYQAQFEEQEE